jgi:uncharacterized protein with HEPN domain
MSERGDRLYLEDILESADAIVSYTNGLSFEQFVNDRKTYSATIREFEIIGEAVGKLSNAAKNKAPDTPWQDIKDFRNLLIHEYFGVDPEIVWSVVHGELPSLMHSSKRLLEIL